MWTNQTFLANLKPSGECLLWQGGCNRNGYGVLSWGGRSQLAHRVAYQIAYGPIPKNRIVMHSCDVPPCCKPEHVSLGTKRRNSDDMRAKGRARYVRGEEHGRAKLTAAEVQEIRSIVGWGYKSTARLYGVGSRAIQKIRTGQRWMGQSPRQEGADAG